MRITDDSPRVDSTDHPPLSDHDEDALETIRRQLDAEFSHFSAPVEVAPPVERPAPRRRGHVTTALGLLIACAGGVAATVFFTTLYQTLTAPSAVDRQPPLAPGPAPMTPLAVATPPATILPTDTSTKPSRVQRESTKPPGVPRANSAPIVPVPDVIRVTEPAPARREAAAIALAAPVAPPPLAAPTVAAPTAAAPTAAAPIVAAPPVAARTDVVPIVAVPPPAGDVVSTAPASVTAPAPKGTALPLATLVQLTSEHVRTAWEVVKERVVGLPGAIAQPPRAGAEAP